MKEFRCKKCDVYLGEMINGKIKKDAIILCYECMGVYKTYESLANLKHGDSKPEMPEFLNNLFRDKKSTTHE